MRETLQTIGGILGFLIVILVIQFAFDPQAGQENAIKIINAVANVWHAAINAFSR